MAALTPTLAPVRTARDAVRDVTAMLHLRPVLVTSDFDGTLSVPQLDPWGATVLPGAQRALRTLTTIEGVHVALLSGRTASDLSARVRVGAAGYLGNQGLEATDAQSLLPANAGGRGPMPSLALLLAALLGSVAYWFGWRPRRREIGREQGGTAT